MSRERRCRSVAGLCTQAASLLVSLLVFLPPDPTQAAVGRTEGTFAVDAIGAANYRIPLWVPQAGGELSLDLALSYSSSRGNGLLGVGWAVEGLSEIRRCAGSWAQDGEVQRVRLLANDAYCLDGQRLRRTGGTYGAANSTYGTEIERFARITAKGSISSRGPEWFEVESRNGLIYEYGRTEAHRIESGTGSSKAATVWALSAIRDRSGNEIQITYLKDDHVLRPQYISYPHRSGGPGPYYRLVFVYEQRPAGDVLHGGFAGQRWTLSHRLNEVRVEHQDGSWQEARRYDLEYEAGPASGRSRLISVQECAGSDCLGASTIDYQDRTPGWGSEQTTGGSSAYYKVLLDIDGDGRSDLVGENNVSFSNGAGFGSPVSLPKSNPSWIPIDSHGDGRTALLWFNHSGGNLRLIRWTGSSFSDDLLSIASPSDIAEVKVADYDGDGLPDILIAGNVGQANSRLMGYRNLGGGSFAAGVVVWEGDCSLRLENLALLGTWPNLARLGYTQGDVTGDRRANPLMRLSYRGNCSGPIDNEFWTANELGMPGASGFDTLVGGIYFEDAKFHPPIPIDLTGDGLTEYLLVAGSEALGYMDAETKSILWKAGDPTPQVVSSNLPQLFPFLRPQVVDWDGDGRQDLLLGPEIYLSRGDGTFEEPIDLNLQIPTNFWIATGDIDGNGRPDLLSGSIYSGPVYARMAEDRDVGLAVGITDGFGVTHEIAYASIAGTVHSQGSTAAFPYQDIGAGQYVVSEVESTTPGTGAAAGTVVQTYTYSGARMNRQGRGFIGFESREVNDSRSGQYQTTDYYQTFPYYRSIQLIEDRQPNNSTVMRTVERDMDHLTLSGDRYYPYVEETVTETREVGGPRDGTLLSRVTETVESLPASYYGTPEQVRSVIQDLDSQSPWQGQSFVRLTQTTLSADTTNWCVKLPGSVSVTETLPNMLSETRTVSYAVDGSYCRTDTETVEPNSTDGQKTITAYRYDTCGNRDRLTVTGQKPDGSAMAPRITELNHGSRCQRPETITNAEGEEQTLTYRWDLGGLPHTQTDANGLQTTLGYDAFGRLASETYPDGTSVTYDLLACTSGNSWCGSADPAARWSVTQTRRTTSQASMGASSAVHSAFDRVLMQATDLPVGDPSKVYAEYDAWGRPVFQSAPTLGGISTIAGGTEIDYDLRGRPIEERVKKGSTTHATTTYSYQGHLTRLTNAQNHVTEVLSDARGDIRQIIDPSPGGTTEYDYDPFRNLVQAEDAGNAATTGAETFWFYNARGYLVATIDPGRGQRNYDVNSLGEVVEVTDAKGQVMTLTYDNLSRMTGRVDDAGTQNSITSSWSWGSSPGNKNVGQLTALSGPGYSESYTYDSLGRLSQRSITADSTTYHYHYGYNATTGLQATLEYPQSTGSTPLKLQYDYTLGVLTRISDYHQGTQVYWELDQVNAQGRATQETLGNGAVIQSGFDEVTGLIGYRIATVGSQDQQDLEFNWDNLGRLQSRIDHLQSSLTEAFTHDSLDRLTDSTRNSVTNLAMQYGKNGVIESWDDRTYSYSSARPYAPYLVTEQTGALCYDLYNYTYDLNGNQTHVVRNSTELLREVTWTSYDYPATITAGTSSAAFHYTPNRDRWKQVASYDGSSEVTRYIGEMLEIVTRGTATEYRHQIPLGGSATAVHVRGTGYGWTFYVTKDHLGSGSLVMGEGGALIANRSFGSFGERRGPAWHDEPTLSEWGTIEYTTRRGFTWHEHLDSVNLIHMNGRVYDPWLGQFLSADPVDGNVYLSQRLNRYSYVMNSPHQYTDPTGFYLCASDDNLCTERTYSSAWTYSSSGQSSTFSCRGNECTKTQKVSWDSASFAAFWDNSRAHVSGWVETAKWAAMDVLDNPALAVMGAGLGGGAHTTLPPPMVEALEDATLEDMLEAGTLAVFGPAALGVRKVGVESAANLAARQAAKDSFRREAGENTLRVLRDRNTGRVVGVGAGRASYRPKRDGSYSVTPQSGRSRDTQHYRPDADGGYSVNQR